MPTAEDLRALVRDDDEAAFTDEQLDAALLASGDNLLRAAGFAYQALAAEYALRGKSVRTDDLAIDTRDRGKTLLEVAQSYFDEAAAAQNAEGGDLFQIVPFAGRAGRGGCCRPEGSPRPLGGFC
jgi:hypothetical protein